MTGEVFFGQNLYILKIKKNCDALMKSDACADQNQVIFLPRLMISSNDIFFSCPIKYSRANYSFMIVFK